MPAQLSECVSDGVIETFLEKLKPFGIERFFYSILPDDLVIGSQPGGAKSNQEFNKVNTLKKMQFAVASDDEILLLRHELLSRYIANDTSFERVKRLTLSQMKPFIWPDCTIAKKQKSSFEAMMARHNVQTRLTFCQPLEQRTGGTGMMFLFSPDDSSSVRAKIDADYETFEQLIRSQSNIFSYLAIEKINPISNFGFLSESCIRILAMVAEGDSSESIAKKLHLTERGVNYHIDRARIVLDAKNRTNLISKAHRAGLLQ